MTTRLALAAIGFLAGSLAAALPAGAGVVVLDNHSGGKIEFTIGRTDGQSSRNSLDSGDLAPIAASDPVDIVFDSGSQPTRYSLQVNRIYCFVRRGKKLDLSELALPTAGQRGGRRGQARPGSHAVVGIALHGSRDDPGR